MREQGRKGRRKGKEKRRELGGEGRKERGKKCKIRREQEELV